MIYEIAEIGCGSHKTAILEVPLTSRLRSEDHNTCSQTENSRQRSRGTLETGV
jgi:hypothetical protein